jgi:acyl carrier protein
VCGKLGDNEIESLQNMMSLAVYSVLADVFNRGIENIAQNYDLRNDLGMTPAIQRKLNIAISDIFDNIHLDFNQINTVQDVIDQVVKSKMNTLINNNA